MTSRIIRSFTKVAWIYQLLLWVPDWLVRMIIRRQIRDRLSFEEKRRLEDPAWDEKFFAMMKASEIAPRPDLANAQHYELPSNFYEYVLGRRLKYSSALWDSHGLSARVTSAELADGLSEAEERMLAVVAERAEIEDGMSILDLGCGWGSLSLYLLEQFPKLQVTALSNSHSQRKFIEARARALGLAERLTVITENIETFSSEGKFDRILSIEMFEHMRNHDKLLAKIAPWLKEVGGKVFVHVFAHRKYNYLFNDDELGSWMSRTFFSEGMMPCVGSFNAFPDALKVEQSWVVSGEHYGKTAEAWLARHERFRREIEKLFANEAGFRESSGDVLAPKLQWMAWKLFFLACAELFAYRGGSEWCVAHYLFVPVAVSSAAVSSTRDVVKDEEKAIPSLSKKLA